MDLTPAALARLASWIATGLGVGLWAWSWIKETNPIQKQRFMDCGVVLVFAATLVRVVVQEREMTPIDWALVLLSPLFIAAALWRLARTACPGDVERR
ncbi:hypothetical protein KOAAANKH_03487 [Brevundimonas sp. NIBR10]|uniref:hypothetical protein n=1 Tax=Brevundimonas sp. NIBR10 TaxID=3015997 RepID=UPI0022F1A9D5|nr:hypothetical protein [Brevundimonas sp. NIBR10]WGM48585.1 hypothetical protein KOAAANKH_03487 [Brevundimonas sp. NIBR10]